MDLLGDGESLASDFSAKVSPKFPVFDRPTLNWSFLQLAIGKNDKSAKLAAILEKMSE